MSLLFAPALASPLRPLFPLGVGGLAALLLLVMVGGVVRSPSAPPTPPTPARCGRWIAVRGAIQRPQVVCGTALAPPLSRQWRALVERAQPRCRLPARLPLPAHGQQLVLRRPLRSGEPCRATVGWLSGMVRVGLGIPLRLNHDSARDLAAIPGLSRRLAQRIVARRERHGMFASLRALGKVKGIGPKTIARLRPFLSLSRPTQRPPKKASPPSARP